uniref:Reverse transcriptase zinc-binding domain-containing protein n=1 Tax=Nicotiana tabacum TaxID=4097 RepID=A0A1S3ZDL4_TOBAC|nr:PREDICTED: uncharacterized protein LOC107785694 [Nicotiana tabacum]
MTCVSTVNYSILLNGGLTPIFQAKRGLRQGDPMSPYLFVLAMEYLNRSLKQLRHKPDFNYHPRADQLSISLIMQAFNHFSSVCGLKSNLEKSSFYVAGVTQEFSSHIMQEMHFSGGEIPFKYLGIPLSSRKLNFLWTGRNEYSRRALVAWSIVCMPKVAGGLNILDIFIWNKAAICKLLWVVGKKKEKLWVQWIHCIYIKGRDLASMPTPNQGSWIVRKIFEARKWMIGDPLDDLNACEERGKFSIKKAYQTFMPQLQKVSWKSRGIQVEQECVLCNTTVVETLEHLFFDCGYSKVIWSTLLHWLGERRLIRSWEEEIEWTARRTNNSRARAGIIGFLFAASVYQIWPERNGRRFNNQRIASRQLIKEVILQLHAYGQRQSKWRQQLDC